MPPHSLTVPLPQDCRAFWLVPMSIVVEATSKWTAWLPLRVFCIWCVTILGVPGWAPTEDTQPELWAKACLGCNPSHQVWIVRTSGERQYTLVPEGFPPRSLHACAGWHGTCDDISRRKGQIGIITSSHCALFLDRVRYLYTSCRIRHWF